MDPVVEVSLLWWGFAIDGAEAVGVGMTDKRDVGDLDLWVLLPLMVKGVVC